MGCICGKKEEKKSIQPKDTDNIPKVYFVKDKREIAFNCSKTEIMKDVVRRFCTQYNFRKKDLIFIHNNNKLDEKSTYDKLIPNEYNKRIINVDINDLGSDNELVNMESIISKVNYDYIIKQSYKTYYKDEGVLSDNGHYKIHKASRKNSYEKYAIKIFDFNNIIAEYKNDRMKDPGQKDMEVFVQGLIEQIRVMKILSNGNINSVKLYECFLTKDEFAMVMEFCDTNMSDLYTDNPTLFSLEKVYQILTQLNNTFLLMARNNFIHGDIKLDNILVKYTNSYNDYILKLTDYGVSNKNIFNINAKFGAKNAELHNMPPEMLRSEDNYSQECDLWSLGILIHRLLTKRYPYEGGNQREILNNIYKYGMKNIQKTGNLEMDHLLRRLLAKNVKDRITWNEYFIHPFFTGGDSWKYYIKEKQIGKGKYYTVWKCKSITGNEYRAIKIIDFKTIRSAFSKEYLRHPTEEDMKVYINYLITETENMESIGGENEININTVKFYEYFITKNEFCIVMELCDTDLKKLSIEKSKTFKPMEIYDILTQLNNTFKIMAKYNLIHRDIKLENILVKYDGGKYIYKLTGYEMSKQILNLVEKYHGKIGAYKYMAPEILRGEPFNQECDLWSLGICIYLLCFKEYPFNGDTEIQVLNDINEISPQFFLKTNDRCLDDLISRLLTKDPTKRMTWNEYFGSPFFCRNYNIRLQSDQNY